MGEPLLGRLRVDESTSGNCTSGMRRGGYEDGTAGWPLISFPYVWAVVDVFSFIRGLRHPPSPPICHLPHHSCTIVRIPMNWFGRPGHYPRASHPIQQRSSAQ